MGEQFLEAGKIVNTHGIRGEVRIEPWCDGPEFLCGFDTFYIDGRAVKVENARVHKSSVLATIGGACDINEAMKLVGKVVYFDRGDANLAPGQLFISDIVGLKVLDASTGEPIGTVADVLKLPANDVYVVRGEREYFIPAVGQFVKEISMDEGLMRVELIEGMALDEN